MQSYTTLLGTRAYILGNVSIEENPHQEEEEEEEKSKKIRHRSSNLIRERQNIPIRKRRWRGVSFPSTVGEDKNKILEENKQNDNNLFITQPYTINNSSSINNNNGIELNTNLTHLLPTTVLVPPISSALSPSVITKPRREVIAPNSANPMESSNIPFPYYSYSINTSEPNKMSSIPAPQSFPFTSSVQEKELASINSKLEPETITSVQHSILPSSSLLLLNTDQNKKNHDIFSCSIEDHEFMSENGFVFCPKCGIKVIYGALMEFSSVDCPANHEMISKKDEDKENNYCVLCGTPIIYRTLSNQDKLKDDEKVNDIKLDVNQIKVPSFSTPMYTTDNSIAHIIDTTENEKGSSTGTKFSEKILPKVLKEIDSTKEITPSTDISISMNQRKSNEHDENLSKVFTRNNPIFSSFSSPTVTGVVKKEEKEGSEEKGIDKNMASPSTFFKETKLYNSFNIGESAALLSSTSEKTKMLYTVGVPGVSCGLPHCALCLHLLDFPLPPVKSISEDIFSNKEEIVTKRNEAGVVVVHNHYYHKM